MRLVWGWCFGALVREELHAMEIVLCDKTNSNRGEGHQEETAKKLFEINVNGE